MGAGFSAAAVDDSSETGLRDIPESCVASILLHLTPTEICKLARLNRAFRGAALADFVWESKLPRNYGYLVDKLFDGVPESFRKKEIYARLCRPNSFDEGTKVGRGFSRSLCFVVFFCLCGVGYLRKIGFLFVGFCVFVCVGVGGLAGEGVGWDLYVDSCKGAGDNGD